MLHIGLTGGIASGKSTVASVLADLGAVVIDADAIAREVVEPGTPGLAAVVEAFGDHVLTVDGALDRSALGRVVFADDAARRRLGEIVHPLVGSTTAARLAELPADAVVVHDVPLIVENRLAVQYHLVVVVGASEEIRTERLVRERGMRREDALARIAAQADDAARRTVADVWIDNEGPRAEVTSAVGRLWSERIAPYARNVRDRVPAPREEDVVLTEPPPPPRTWAVQADALLARLRRAGGDRVLTADHIGSTAVPGLPAKDVLDLQVGVATLDDADALAEAFGDAGFPARPGDWVDTPKPGADPDPAAWRKRFHASADPGRPVNLHVRVAGGPAWRYALAFRDWLRDDAQALADYLAVKRSHVGPGGVRAYAEAKEPWFTEAWPRLREWVAATGWDPGPPHR